MRLWIGLLELASLSDMGRDITPTWRWSFGAVLILLLWAGFGLSKAKAAYQPGPVQVEKLTDASPATGENHPIVDDLTTQLKKQLATTGLFTSSDPMTASPSLQAQPQNFLELLGEVDPDPKKLGLSLLRAWGRARPRVAYRVSGVLQTRDTEDIGRFGVTITVTGLALEGSSSYTHWAKSWQEAVEVAGYWAMATLLPVTRLCKNPPWTAWRGRMIPVELFRDYQQASKFAAEGRLDEALDKFDKALSKDPLNPYIRAEIAVVLRRLGLYLDALYCYQGALTLDGQSVEDYNTRLWARWGRKRRLRYLRLLMSRPDVINVRYGYAQLLGTWEQVATQWLDAELIPEPPPRSQQSSTRRRKAATTQVPTTMEPVVRSQRNVVGERAQVRGHLRTQLAPDLIARYWPIFVDPVGTTDADAEQEARRAVEAVLLGKDGEEPRAGELRTFFQKASLREMYRLAEDRKLTYVSRFLPGGRAPRLTGASLRLFRDVIAPLRLCSVMAHEDDDDDAAPFRTDKASSSIGGDNLPRLGIPRRIHRRMKALHWPVAYECSPNEKVRNTTLARVRTLQQLVEKAMPNRLWQWLLPEWAEHYNAACAYAYALIGCGVSRGSLDLENPDPGDPRVLLANLAFRELRTAARISESGAFAAQEMWTLSADPDLSSFRQYMHFRKFAEDAYPRLRANRYTSQVQFVDEITDYDRQLIRDTARKMEEIWHRRLERYPTVSYMHIDMHIDIHTPIRWLECEVKIWEDLARIAANQARNWPDRAELIRAVLDAAENAADREGFHPSISESNRDAGGGSGYQRADYAFNRLGNLIADGSSSGRLTPSSTDSPLGLSRELLTQVRKMDSTGQELSGMDLRTLAIAYAAVWQNLREWFALGQTDRVLNDAIRMIRDLLTEWRAEDLRPGV